MSVVAPRWTPYRLPSLRLLHHMPYEMALRGLVPGRTAEDRFGRADSAVTLGNAETGQPWVARSGTWGVSSNAAYTPVVGAYPQLATIDAGLLNADIRMDVGEFLVTAANTDAGVTIRTIDGANYLRAYYVNDGVSITTWKLDKVVGGVVTNLASSTVTAIASTARRRWRFNINGNVISWYREGSLVLTYTLAGGDAAQFGAAGATGVGMIRIGATTGTAHRWDNFRVDALNTTSVLSGLTDNSGLGFNAAQATLSKQALGLHDGTRWVMRQDGVDDIITGSSAVSSAMLGYLMVAIAQEPVLGTSCVLFSFADEAATSQHLSFRINPSAQVEINGQNGAAGTADVVSGHTVLTTGVPYILEFASDGSQYFMWVNGVAQLLTVTAGSNTGDWVGDLTGTDNYAIGGLKRTTESAFCLADACTYLLMDAMPSTGDQNRVRRWANDDNRLGLTI